MSTNVGDSNEGPCNADIDGRKEITACPCSTRTPLENNVKKDDNASSSESLEKAAKPHKYIRKKRSKREGNVVTSTHSSGPVTTYRGHITRVNTIPAEILNDPAIFKAISVLPKHYKFEIHKTIWRLRHAGSKRVALQFPEGLLAYSCIIADILECFCGVECVIMGDVTYGACCVDDYTARALKCDFLVHYGHSCLVPISKTSIQCLYVFVEIAIDSDHFIATVKHNLSPSISLALVGTVQFTAMLQEAKRKLLPHFRTVIVPQARPLSQGELLGCTSPILPPDIDSIVYLADGRFHMESVMISNPSLSVYQYDPYSQKFTREEFRFKKMMSMRKESIEKAKGANEVGVVVSTLGRQGSSNVAGNIKSLLKKKNINYTEILMSEIFPHKLALFEDIDAYSHRFIQVGCPRLSIDWGAQFQKPLLNPYEAFVAFGDTPWSEDSYPMDYYRKDGGEWSVYFKG